MDTMEEQKWRNHDHNPRPSDEQTWTGVSQGLTAERLAAIPTVVKPALR
jgi:hypothetical protein